MKKSMRLTGRHKVKFHWAPCGCGKSVVIIINYSKKNNNDKRHRNNKYRCLRCQKEFTPEQMEEFTRDFTKEQ